MLIHSMLPRSTVNGPGARAVVWLQGCDLRCTGCCNPSSHAFDRSLGRPVGEIGAWILACPGIQGVTFSGGEPFQQAPELRLICEYLRVRQPALSIGVFTGYTPCPNWFRAVGTGGPASAGGPRAIAVCLIKSGGFSILPYAVGFGRGRLVATSRCAGHSTRRSCSSPIATRRRTWNRKDTR